MVPFAGFSMPVQYTSIFDEHRAVRERAGLFDVSHMGQLHLSGPGAVADAEQLVSCPVESLRPGRVRYGLLCNEQGGVVDDVTVYRVAERELFFCVNAANIDKDRTWLESHLAPDTRLEDRSGATGLLALQGPLAGAILAPLCEFDVLALRRFRFAGGTVAGIEATVSRTGYTGSDGFELYAPAERSADLFRALLAAGRPRGLAPAGLGARDTLRLEAALPLYGHELDDTTTPLEAGLERFVKLAAGGFVGAAAIAASRRRGIERRLAGFVVEAKGVVRAAQVLSHEGRAVGAVTSGAPSPTLGKSIGLGYVPPALAAPGILLHATVRQRELPVRVVETPFV
jgi:aminomethyltransferase